MTVEIVLVLCVASSLGAASVAFEASDLKVEAGPVIK